MMDLFGDLSAARIAVTGGTELAAVVASVPDGVDPRGIALCVHGFTGSKEDFIACVDDIAARGYIAVAYDLRGHYESGGAEGPFTLEQLASDLRDVARWAQREYDGLPVHLVGHSFGGLIAQHAVGRYPDAFASLNLVCSGPAGVAVEGWLEQQITIGRLNEIIAALELETSETVWERKAQLEGLDTSDPLVRFLHERWARTSQAALLSTAWLILGSPGQTAAAAEAGIPVSWCHGEHDGSWAQSTQAAAALRLGTETVPIPDSTHMPMLENIDGFVAFLCDRLDAVTA